MTFSGAFTTPEDLVLVPRSLVNDVLVDLGNCDGDHGDLPKTYHKLKALVPTKPVFPPNTLNSEGALKMTTTPCPSSQTSK